MDCRPRIQIVAYVVAVHIVGGVHLLNILRHQIRRYEVPVAGARVSAPRQVCAAIRRIIYADHHLARQHALDTEVPLVNIRVSRLFRSQIISIVVSPLSQSSVLRALWLRESEREGILECRKARLEIGVAEQNWITCGKGCAGILEVCCRIKSVVDACPASHHRGWI